MIDSFAHDTRMSSLWRWRILCDRVQARRCSMGAPPSSQNWRKTNTIANRCTTAEQDPGQRPGDDRLQGGVGQPGDVDTRSVLSERVCPCDLVSAGSLLRPPWASDLGANNRAGDTPAIQ